MSTKIIIAVIIIALLGVGGYMLFAGQDEAVVTAENSSDTNTAQESEGKKMAFTEFMKQGGTYKCEVNQNIGDTTTQGTTYMDGGMIRGEYVTQVQGMTVSSYSIIRDGYSYGWSSIAPTMGYKVKLDTAATSNTSADVNTNTSTSGSYTFNAETIGDYNCEAWTADASMFALPAGVTFREV